MLDHGKFNEAQLSGASTLVRLRKLTSGTRAPYSSETILTNVKGPLMHCLVLLLECPTDGPR